MDKLGQIVLKKGASLAAKKVLNKELDLNRGRAPGGDYVSIHPQV
jgi:hypothetical protein